MIEINKTVLAVSAFSLIFTEWWAWERDAGPLIRRHTAPEKLVREVTKTFLPYFERRNIRSIRFGKKKAIS